MRGNGIFFNMMEDLLRFEELTKPTTEAPNGYIDWIAPIMAPDQSSVQENRRKWSIWRSQLAPRVKFFPWIVCDDPEEDALMAAHIADNYVFDGMLFNCEKSYESTGKWKASVLVARLMDNPKIAPKPKILSYPSTPAERYDMDYRAFERGGFTFAPQAYWLDPTVIADGADATPKSLYTSTYLPKQLAIGRDYRIQVAGIQEKHWSRIVSWNGGLETVVKDLRANKLYRMPVVPKQQGDFRYFEAAPNRALMDYKTGKIVVGKMLGFQASDRIHPTVGYYPNCTPTPQAITDELNKIRYLKGASLYLGETSGSEHVKAIWQAIQ